MIDHLNRLSLYPYWPTIGNLEWLHYPLPMLCLIVRASMSTDKGYCITRLTIYHFSTFTQLCTLSLAWPQVNCGLLGNIIRVLCTKLRSSPAHFRAALRATLFLVPVFGVHYVFYVTKGRMVETCDAFLNFLFYLSIAVDCLQGVLVAMTFCILNSEVMCMISPLFIYCIQIYKYEGQSN